MSIPRALLRGITRAKSRFLKFIGDEAVSQASKLRIVILMFVLVLLFLYIFFKNAECKEICIIYF